MNYPVPANEVDRLRALRSYKILDTKPEERFDELTQLAGPDLRRADLVDLVDRFRPTMVQIAVRP
jgi:hypothetical protein